MAQVSGVAPGRREQRPTGRDAKIVVAMPAHNAARTLTDTVSGVPLEWVDEIILVDDKSTDDTVDLARSLTHSGVPLRLIWHPHNVGYGGNQKTCYLEALQRGADVVVMLHPDGQYEPEIIPRMVTPILEDRADMVLGSRFAEPGAARAGGMPLYKYAANRVLTSIENGVLRTSFTELHTGYRAYSRELLLTVPFLRNALDFSFDTEMIMQAVEMGFRVTEVPARSRYFEDASSVTLKPAVAYGLKSVWAALRLVLHRHHILRSRKFER